MLKLRSKLNKWYWDHSFFERIAIFTLTLMFLVFIIVAVPQWWRG